MEDFITLEQHLQVLAELLGEPVRICRHSSGHWRVDPVVERSCSLNAEFWRQRGYGGWFPSVEKALAHVAYTYGGYAEPPAEDTAIDQAILELVGQHRGHYTARKLRGMANRQTGEINCAAARCDAAIRRLIDQGMLQLINADGRSAGRLILAHRTNPIGILPIDASEAT